jgi:putative transposase
MAGRKFLPHNPPLWVDPSREVYFVTLNCRLRGRNSLCNQLVARQILESVEHRNRAGVWWARLFLLMPDHVHALLSFPPDRRIAEIVRDWKKWTSRQSSVEWQRDWFDHRLRAEESLREKADYIMNNPVRAGLTDTAENWPWVWMPKEDVGGMGER